ncbi:MAG: SRPBCC domain-containing protein [Actinomycetales bacterium]|jgi:hypothetical protein
MDTTQLSVHINADAEQVWHMLREPSLIAQWYGWETNGLDEEIQQIYYNNVLESPDHRRLTLEMGDVFALEPVTDGTVLTMTRGKATGEWEPYDADITEGWSMFMAQLKFALERHPHAHRRTIYADGQSTTGQDPWELLGIDTGWLPDPGQDYDLTLNTGLRLTGKVWYRSESQLGLTVHDYAEHGDGLLILARQAPLSNLREHPGAVVIASTYGLGATAFEKAAAHWDDFMETHYPEG